MKRGAIRSASTVKGGAAGVVAPLRVMPAQVPETPGWRVKRMGRRSVPSASNRPSWMMPMVSQSFSTSLITWVE